MLVHHSQWWSWVALSNPSWLWKLTTCLWMIQYFHTSIFSILPQPILICWLYLSYPSWIEGFLPTLPPPFLRLPKAQSSGSGSDDVATAGGDKSITQWEMVEVEAKELTIRISGQLVAWGGLKKKKKATQKGSKKIELKRMFEEWNDYDDYGWSGKRTLL